VSTRASLADHAAQGLAAGALFGGLDVLLVHLYAPGVHATEWLLLAWITVGLFGTAAGFALGAALRLVAGRRADWRGFELSTLGALLVVYGLVLLVINIHVLRVLPGDLLSAPVLGANAAIAAALAASIRLARARTQSGRSVLARVMNPRGSWTVVSIWLLAMGAFAGALHLDARGLAAPSETAGDRRDVLWIVMDTTRADAVLIPGATPSLERLAGGGARFENAYAAASWTLPSHASMFTGTYPSRHGLTGLTARFVSGEERQGRGPHFVQGRLSERTIADVFRAAGYATVGFSENPWVSPGTGLATGFEQFQESWDLPGRNGTLFERVLKQARIAGLLPATHTHRTVASVRRWLRKRDPRRPFFAFVNFLEAHAPYAPPSAFAPQGARARSPSPALRRAAEDPLSYVAGEADLDVDELAALRALYQAEVTSLDAEIGELLTFLEASELLANSIVVVTSDHGENFGWQGLASHAFALNEALIRVPLIVHAHGIIPPARSIAHAVSLVDLFPTLLALCGVPFEHPDRLQGLSLVPLLEAEPEPESELARRSILAEDAENRALLDVAQKDYPAHDWSRYARSLQSIMHEGVKYVRASDGSHDLYDLAHDPDEHANLIDEKATLATELAALLEQQVRITMADGRPEDEPAEMLDLAVQDRLRSLGYID
jgi:arylsulfatase A-like enzyme